MFLCGLEYRGHDLIIFGASLKIMQIYLGNWTLIDTSSHYQSSLALAKVMFHFNWILFVAAYLSKADH